MADFTELRPSDEASAHLVKTARMPGSMVNRLATTIAISSAKAVMQIDPITEVWSRYLMRGSIAKAKRDPLIGQPCLMPELSRRESSSAPLKSSMAEQSK